MTQNTNTKLDIARTVANLTASIRRTTGVVRDNHARALLDHVSLDLVSMLVAASDRYHAAERALDEAEATMSRAMDAVRNMTRTDTGRNVHYAIVSIATTARTYVISLSRGNVEERGLAQNLFIEATRDVTELMATTEGRAEIPTLAWAAMSSAMAEETERATKDAYRTLQTVIQNQNKFH
jgi:hypothetical protein